MSEPRAGKTETVSYLKKSLMVLLVAVFITMMVLLVIRMRSGA